MKDKLTNIICPLFFIRREKWSLSNLITSKTLKRISDYGGPRCCKRVSNIAMETAIDFIYDKFNIKLETEENFKCEFKKYNKECIKNRCKYFK